METSLLEIHEDGLEIGLIDGSQWRITNVGDISKTALWYPTQQIEIEEDNSGEYYLINHSTSAPDKIKVSRIF